MPALIPRRAHAGRYEFRCSCGRWYAKLAQHLHRYHAATCRCIAVCCRPGKPARVHRAA